MRKFVFLALGTIGLLVATGVGSVAAVDQYRGYVKHQTYLFCGELAVAYRDMHPDEDPAGAALVHYKCMLNKGYPDGRGD